MLNEAWKMEQSVAYSPSHITGTLTADMANDVLPYRATYRMNWPHARDTLDSTAKETEQTAVTPCAIIPSGAIRFDCLGDASIRVPAHT